MGIPLYVICCFSLVAFNIFSLYLIFVSLINLCLSIFLVLFILNGTLCFLDMGDYFLSHVREIFYYDLFKYFLRPFLYLFFFWNPIIQMLVCLTLFQRSLRLSSFLFILFSLFCSAANISTILSSRSLIPSSASVFLLLITSVYFSFQLLPCSSLFVL